MAITKKRLMTADSIAPWAEPALLTAEQLIALPEDSYRYELVQGRLVREPPTGWEHGSTTDNLYGALRGFVMAHGLGRVAPSETGFNLTELGQDTTVLAPDLAFVAAGRVPRQGSDDYKKYPHLAPDLVVEVASPDQFRPEMAAKARLWLSAGVRLVWIVWPSARKVDVWLPGSDQPEGVGEGGVLDGRDVVPGFTYAAADLFK